MTQQGGGCKIVLPISSIGLPISVVKIILPAKLEIGSMIGERLSHYRIEEQIGAGGMGVVYRAHDEQLD
ncbi:MAG TPA: hypothetical protein VFE61_20955, partial [Candidatus Sulfotelmatobacter sp.]|nr:hypothetical protein [Candidatus Sulfotelmatobacter sp.]